MSERVQILSDENESLHQEVIFQQQIITSQEQEMSELTNHLHDVETHL